MTLDAMCKSDASTISLAKNGDDGQIAPSVEGLRKKDLKKLNDMWCKGSMALQSGATSKAEQFLQKAGIRQLRSTQAECAQTILPTRSRLSAETYPPVGYTESDIPLRVFLHPGKRWPDRKRHRQCGAVDFPESRA